MATQWTVEPRTVMGVRKKGWLLVATPDDGVQYVKFYSTKRSAQFDARLASFTLHDSKTGEKVPSTEHPSTFKGFVRREWYEGTKRRP